MQRDGTDFNMTETQGGKTRQGDAILVISRRQPDGVGKVKSEHVHGMFRGFVNCLKDLPGWRKNARQPDQLQGQMVGSFRVEFEKKRAE